MSSSQPGIAEIKSIEYTQPTRTTTPTCGSTLYETYVAAQRDLDVYAKIDPTLRRDVMS